MLISGVYFVYFKETESHILSICGSWCYSIITINRHYLQIKCVPCVHFCYDIRSYVNCIYNKKFCEFKISSESIQKIEKVRRERNKEKIYEKVKEIEASKCNVINSNFKG